MNRKLKRAQTLHKRHSVQTMKKEQKMLIRQTPLAKSPNALTNEQVEAWMSANPDRVQHLDNTAYDHSISQSIKTKPEKRKQVKRLDSKAIKDALAKQQRQTPKKVPVACSAKSKQAVKSATNKQRDYSGYPSSWG